MTLHHFQELVDGKSRRVRRCILDAMEDLVRADGPGPRDIEEELEGFDSRKERLKDLGWVRAEPVAEMAQEWLSRHPGSSCRRLARQVARSVHRMGYSIGLSTLQPVLGGKKKKTRGFVYRAMARQMGKSAAIPEEHRVRSKRSLDLAGGEGDGLATLVRRIAGLLARGRDLPRPAVSAFLSEARRHLGRNDRSPHLPDLLALRMERVYGIPRARAARLLQEGESRTTEGLRGEETDTADSLADASAY